MIPCWTNLISVKLDEISFARSVSAAEVKAVLNTLDNYVSDTNVRDIWNLATFCGTGFKLNAANLVGISMAIAPVAGIGLCTFAWPNHLSQATVAEVNKQGEILQIIATAAKNRMKLPVAAVTNFISDTEYPFEVAFRRRIAYAIGFHASLLKQNINYYDAWFKTIIIGEVSQAETIGNDENKLIEFSVVLNLLARLNGTMAYEQDNGKPHDKVSEQVRDYEAKLAILEHRLQCLANLINQDFNEDGKVALNALLYEVNNQQKSGIWNVLDSPCWGKIANSSVFYSKNCNCE